MDTTLHRVDEDAEELQEEPTACAFFCFPCSGRRRHAGLEHRSLLPAGANGGWEERPPREPKGRSRRWVALLRRFICRGGGGRRRRRRAPQFQYDPASYALNFDDGAGHHLGAAPAADRPFLGFSSTKHSHDDT